MEDSSSVSSQEIVEILQQKWIVHVEVCVSPKTTTRLDTIRDIVHNFLTASFECIPLQSATIIDGWQDSPTLASSVERIVISESSSPMASIPVEEAAFQIHTYQPSESDVFEEYSDGSGGQSGGEEVLAASVCELPNRALEGLWDSLIYSDNVKFKLLDYIHATLLLSDSNVDFNLVSWNRVVLLHGPPGTGKTSLCRALAQKLSIRLSHRYAQSRLLEINSHSLFSRWFSESGKLVQRLFSGIMDMVEDDNCFVVVLIDEIESLTAARAGAMAGTEPSDGLRVVNALLTQLDKLKHKKNVLVMSTSNLAKAIDSAFVDRADIIQYIDLPPRDAIYEILRSSLSEIVSKGIIQGTHVPSLEEAKYYEATAKYSQRGDIPGALPENESVKPPQDQKETIGLRILALAVQCRAQGLSGRALRRLPVLALARYMSTGVFFAGMNGPYLTSPRKNDHSNNATSCRSPSTPVSVWLDAIEKVIKDQATEHDRLL